MEFSAELEFGKAIDEVLKTEVLANFVVENYFAKTNRSFFELIFKFYESFDKRIEKLITRAKDSENETELHIGLLEYSEDVLKAKREAIELFISKCKEIVRDEQLDFDIEGFFAEQANSNEAIIEVMKEIRSKEEAK